MNFQGIKTFMCGGIISLLSTVFLGALPLDPTVVTGNVTFDNSQQLQLTVTSTSDLSIVDWDSFSIDLSETTVFNLPSSNSSILCRVTGANSGVINGTITSNGNVFLINNNGITWGPVSSCQADTFLVSTLDVDDADFLGGGDMTFTNSTSQMITCNGAMTATAGDVIMLGFQVVHSGTKTASLGSVSIGAGSEIIFQPTNSQRLMIVQGSSGNTPIGINILPRGIIQALQAEIRADGNLYMTPVDHEGTMASTGTMAQGGNVILDATGGFNYLNGNIAAQNFDGTGGVVTVLGGSIELDSSCVIDCSGGAQGGQVYVGGGFNGFGTPYNSRNTVMQGGAQITVDGNTRIGSGGQVVVWSDVTTSFFPYAYITSRGGIQSGNGGTVQVCGAISLTYQGFVNVSSGANGQSGTVCPPSPTANCNGCSP